MLKFLTFISILSLGTAAGAYQLCPDGTYKAACNLCPDGTYQSSCDLRPDGTYGSGSNLCPDGTYGNRCQLCPDGTYQDGCDLRPDGTYGDSRRHEPAPDTDLSTSRDDDSYDDIYSRTDTYEPPTDPLPLPRTEPTRRHSRYNECMRANRHVQPVSARIDLCRHLQSLAEMGVVL